MRCTADHPSQKRRHRGPVSEDTQLTTMKRSGTYLRLSDAPDRMRQTLGRNTDHSVAPNRARLSIVVSTSTDAVGCLGRQLSIWARHHSEVIDRCRVHVDQWNRPTREKNYIQHQRESQKTPKYTKRHDRSPIGSVNPRRVWRKSSLSW